jgi:hypothetical protein
VASDHNDTHAHFDRPSLDEGSARRRDLYLHNTRHSQGTNILVSCGIRTRSPIKLVAAHLRLDCAVTGIVTIVRNTETLCGENGVLTFMPRLLAELYGCTGQPKAWTVCVSWQLAWSVTRGTLQTSLCVFFTFI